jgi:hypothetical protein
MALDKNTLAIALKTTFANAKEQGWTGDQVADALADAIDAYVRGAEVKGVAVDVVDFASHPLGTGKQSSSVHVS